MKQLLVLFFLTSCAYPQKTRLYVEEPTKDKMAIVYLYRLDSSIDSLNPDIPRFFINDKLIGKLRLGGYYVNQVEPGDIKMIYKMSLFGIPLPWISGVVEFKAEPKERYCVKFDIATGMRIESFKLVSHQQCDQEIKSTVLLVN